MAFIGAKPTNVPLTANDITDGSISVAKLTSTLDLSSNTVTLPSGVGGKVLQVVSGTLTSSYTTSSTSFVATGLDVAITPSSTSSKIFIIATSYLDDNGTARDVLSTIFRDSTNLGDSTNGMMDSFGGSTRLRANHSMSFLDSPNSTSAITYEVYYKTGGASVSFNSQGSISSITAMEVSA